MNRVLCLLIAFLALSCTTVPPAAVDTRLHILLTNDDGYGAVGIETLKEALRGAGHRVTVVAPKGNRSGSSASITFGAIRVVEEATDEFSADGSPATCALLGLTAMADLSNFPGAPLKPATAVSQYGLL